MDIDYVREDLADRLRQRRFVTDKTGVRTLEIFGESFLADKEVVFGEVNLDWCSRELAWYESQSLNVNDITPPVPEIWRRVATPSGEINSNYGWCIFSRENGYQYQCCYQELRDNPESRRAVMIYTRPTMHDEYDRDGMSDFMCTNSVQYLVRDGRLHAVVQMRSNDLIFGYKGDRHWQAHVLRILANDLRLEAGEIHWCAGSAHVYERHFFLVDHYSRTGEVAVTKRRYRELYPDSEWAE